MRTRSIVTLSLSPVGLLLFYGLGNIVNGVSEPAAATLEPESDTKTNQSNQSKSNPSPPAPSPVESNSQLEFSAATINGPSPLQLPPPTNKAATFNPPTLNQPAASTGKFELATIQVDATKLDQVIAQSFKGDTHSAPRAATMATTMTAAMAATAPEPTRSASANPANTISVPSANPLPATFQPTSAAIDPLHSSTEVESGIALPETAQLEAIRFIAASGVTSPETFQLASVQTSVQTPAQANDNTDATEPSNPSAAPIESQITALPPTSDANLDDQSVSQPAPAATATPVAETAADATVVAQTPSSGSSSTQVSPANSAGNEAYILGPGDIVQVSFFNVPEYNGQVQVMPDGTVNLPVIGSVAVSGLTLKQAGETIGVRYASELEYSVVSVYLVQPRPLQIALAGEVAQPGLYSIAANQNAQFPAVVQAIQSAGGATQAANLRTVEIRRKDQTGTTRTVTVDLLALLQEGDLSQNSLLQDGDVIFIPATTEVNLADANQLAVSNLRSTTNAPLDVAVVGEVSRPGPYRVDNAAGRPTLVQVIQQAGGITPVADLSQIQLRRKTRQGAEQVVNIDLWQLLQTGDLAQDLVLQQGDTIVIPTARALTDTETAALTGSSLSTGTIQVNIIGEVRSPGALQLQANTTLNQAILAAGGFNGRAEGEVKLIRFNPNGTLTQQQIDIDLTQELDSEANPILHSSDVIVVGRSTGARIRDGLTDVLGIFQLVSPFIPF